MTVEVHFLCIVIWNTLQQWRTQKLFMGGGSFSGIG